jgi:HNH endonuclease
MPTPNWDRISTNRGYLIVHCPDHPHANPLGYIFVHRYVMERHLGRFLSPEELVHRQDRNKRNNDIANLHLTTRIEHGRIHSHDKREMEVRLTCPNCHNPFWRLLRQTHFVKGGVATYCSRRCSGLFSAARAKREQNSRGSELSV